MIDSESGIVAKDGAYVIISDANVRASNVCFSAYKKKQEFFGAYLLNKNHNCSLQKKYFADEPSIIEFK